jgi:hypothetical protein
MRVLVPYIDELKGLDARVVRLADFLGMDCATVALADVTEHARFLQTAVSEDCTCLVVNPGVLKEWLGGQDISAELVAYLLSRFSHLLVCGVRVDAYDSAIVAALSQGRLRSVESLAGKGSSYEISSDSRSICGTFSGLSFAPANSDNDHVFRISENDPAMQTLISIDGRPFMASVKHQEATIVFIAGEDVADLNDEVGEAPLADYFSRLVPHAMALRFAAGDACWRPAESHASIIIDDPLLRKKYGFLNFETLACLAEQHKFHAAIAFIPHNFRRNSPHTTRMFQEHARQLSICFHGNDHTEAEFASADSTFLDTSLRVAEERMNAHRRSTGLKCDRVMVFPQGNFSVEAMSVLKAHNFIAAINTVPHPQGQPARLTLGELAQPAVVRYAGFPLFLRKSIQETTSYDIAFNLFFGRPVLIGEHHGIFQTPESLGEIAAKITAVAPDIHWSNLETVAAGSILTRRGPDGTYHVRAYANTIRIANGSDATTNCSIQWSDACAEASIVDVLMAGKPRSEVEISAAGARVSVELTPGNSQTLTLVHRMCRSTERGLGLRWNTHAFLRRRLSEFRDNYLSKNPQLLTAAKAVQRRLFPA